MSKQRSETISSQKLKFLIAALAAAFLVPVMVLALLIEYVLTFSRTGAGSNALSETATIQRIKPIAEVEVRTAQADDSGSAAGAAAQTAPEVQMQMGEAQARAALASIAKAAPEQHEVTSADAGQAGKVLYEQICQACHASGLMGAPKKGDKAAWASRLKEPLETVYRYALEGKGNMPPKGGSNASDADVKAAVDYLLKGVK